MASPVGVSEHKLDLFLAGMFSAVDALVDRPLDEVLAELGLPEAVIETIEGGDGSELSRIYGLVRAAEAGNPERYSELAEELDVPVDQVAEAYAKAVLFTQRLMEPSDRRSEAG